MGEVDQLQLGVQWLEFGQSEVFEVLAERRGPQGDWRGGGIGREDRHGHGGAAVHDADFGSLPQRPECLIRLPRGHEPRVDPHRVRPRRLDVPFAETGIVGLLQLDQVVPHDRLRSVIKQLDPVDQSEAAAQHRIRGAREGDRKQLMHAFVFESDCLHSVWSFRCTVARQGLRARVNCCGRHAARLTGTRGGRHFAARVGLAWGIVPRGL